jgi:hypothetical protein
MLGIRRIGVIPISMSACSSPAVVRSTANSEKDALSVASYGKQLGRISDALIVLLKHVRYS